MGTARTGGEDPTPPARGRARRRWRARLGLERNDLRRPVDRAQRAVALALLGLLVAIGTPMGVWAANAAHDAGVRAERYERENRYQVVATVTGSGGTFTAGTMYVHETVKATWPVPAGLRAGRERTGTLPSWPEVEVGATRTIWVDGSGEQALRPRSHGRTVTDAGYAALAAVLGTGLPLLCAHLLVRRRCDRYRAALWDAEWARLDTGRGRPNRPG